MANVQSAIKRNRQRLKRRKRNLVHLTTTRTLLKRATLVVAGTTTSKDASPIPAPIAVAAAVRQLDRAAQKGVIKKKTASRKISRLTRALAKRGATASS